MQVALDFLAQLQASDNQHEWYVIARDIPIFADLEAGSTIKLVRRVRDSYFSRFRFEHIDAERLLRDHDINLIYTQFGPGWPVKGYFQIAGCAYSNLFYPELDFWGALPFHARLRKKAIDAFRLGAIKKAQVSIFETEDLAIRARNMLGLDEERIKFVKASVSSLVNQNSRHPETEKRFHRVPEGNNVLLLSGYHVNKNIEFLLRVAKEIKLRGIFGVRFVLTLPPELSQTKNLMDEVRKSGCEDLVYNIGPIPQEGCCEAYRKCKFTILPSMLESFSNTIAETWEMGNPLLVSDLSWARSLCGQAAAYYKYLNVDSFIETLLGLINDDTAREDLIIEGRKQLSTYPTSRQRFESYMSIIEQVVEK